MVLLIQYDLIICQLSDVQQLIFNIGMGNKTGHEIPPMICRNWVQISSSTDIFKNKLTQEYVRQHYCKFTNLKRIQELKLRMKETNPYICRVAFLYHHQKDSYYVYTEENRNIPIVNNIEEWRVHKERIVEAFIILSRRFKPTNVCKEMIGVDFSGQVKVWIHPDPVSSNVWSVCSSQAEMIKDILNVCKQIQEESLKRNSPKKKNFQKQSITPLTSNQHDIRNRNATQIFTKQSVISNKKKQNEGNYMKNFEYYGESNHVNQKKINFQNLNKIKNFSVPQTPQSNSANSDAFQISWDFESKNLNQFFTGQEVQKQSMPDLQNNKKQKAPKKISKIRKMASMNCLKFDLFHEKVQTAHQISLQKINNQKHSKLEFSSSKQLPGKHFYPNKKKNDLQSSTSLTKQSSKKSNFEPSSLNLSSMIEKPSNFFQNSEPKLAMPINGYQQNSQISYQQLFDEKERKQYMEIQQKIKSQVQKYSDLKNQLLEILKDN